jgi:hypothetical protein
MTIVTLLSGRGYAYPADGTRDGGGQGGRCEVGCVDGSPPVCADSISLNAIRDTGGPGVAALSDSLANVDSIGLAVRRRIQCSGDRLER